MSTCTRTTNPAFPRFEVPNFFADEGEVVVSGNTYEHWMWKTGGHNAGEATTEENWYLKRDDEGDIEPGLYNYTYSGPPSAKTSTIINREFADFRKSVDDTVFDLPSFCKKNLKVYN